MVNKLDGSLVLITGAGSGIGRATAVAFASERARVLCSDIDAEAAEKTAALCGEAGAEAHPLVCDVADWAAVRRLAQEVEDRYGPLDVLVNNAGVGMTGRLADMTVDDWRWIRSVNLDGVVHGCLAFGPAMLARGAGAVVNVSSGLAYTPRATEPAYVATKAAVLALSQCLRADWGPQGVAVSAVCPGVIATPIVTATRYVGARGATEVRARAERIFRRGHPPELVGRAVVDAVRRDRAVVTVGWEATLGWWLHRILPLPLQQAAARVEFP
ncbi:MAG TPA: SDR family NAD(P)-dependent oxidoreductase [Acidimicrobiia bacterium]|jgi:NAD(P)-dependent dehydrogenase (short-subunit alcohol dehydrogenase family)